MRFLAKSGLGTTALVASSEIVPAMIPRRSSRTLSLSGLVYCFKKKSMKNRSPGDIISLSSGGLPRRHTMIAYWYLRSVGLSLADYSVSIVLIRAVPQIPAFSNSNPCSLQHPVQVDLGIVDYLRDRPGKTGTDRDQRSRGRLYLG